VHDSLDNSVPNFRHKVSLVVGDYASSLVAEKLDRFHFGCAEGIDV
jgi:hypothetical protein